MKQVLLLLANGFEEYEASAFTDVMGWSRAEGLIPVGLRYTALTSEVRGAWNFKLKTDLAWGQVRVSDFDALAIPGGFEEFGFYKDAYDERFLELIRAFDRVQKPIASICVGALPLGKAGILKNKKATTYNLSKGKRLEQLQLLGAEVCHTNAIIETGHIITSQGPSTAIGVALRLLERLSSTENANTIKHLMRF
ncbi:MAG: DJ-1/PfpI family protein [Bernardetiaceae bacterium]|nr:DJ-1/PfpI family protein [Bernardetiaceae bacterium]